MYKFKGKEYPCCASLTMGIENSLPVNVKINGSPLDVSKEYTVLTSDYLANGGDSMFFFKDPVRRNAVGIKLRDAILEFMVEQQEKNIKITSELDHRIYVDR